ncbi:hypothetical protein [Pseudomonas sp. CLCA07]
MNKLLLEATEKADPASAISVAQLCALTGYSPALISSLKDVLPEPFTVPTGSPLGGKPMQMYPLEKLAELILDRTDFLTDAECRLRVALSTTARKRGSKMSRFYDDHYLFDVDGETLVLPRDTSKLSPELCQTVIARLAADHAELRARRCAKARRQARTHTTTPEGMQP